MAQSLEKRMSDVEYMIAHLPEDLNARFAGVDVKFAAIRETQALHTQRFTTIERKIDVIETRLDGLEIRMDGLESRMDRLEKKFDQLFGQVSEGITMILDRLPRPT